MESVGKHIEHIKEIVAMQQSYAKVSGVYENLSVTELVEDALRMNTAAFGPASHRFDARNLIPTFRRYAWTGTRFCRFFINLLRNAKHAMDSEQRMQKSDGHSRKDDISRTSNNHYCRQWRGNCPGKYKPDF